ncbi:hypothetical protein H2198_001913 [Neophaeococcomyces mojaviensis]|uniref:Uncharacterized protein n=1 Tax=Neophaeococcomyces mojaviensis TaxID=3383035 RepID=A0ACC3AG63_9EURO|nr:hypothetical protein H2198_001913 [Knufia sp. JES_112]
MASAQHRKVPSRASLPRRTTRGPLDQEEDPLSATTSPLAGSQDANPFEQKIGAKVNLLDESPENEAEPTQGPKNLSFILDAAIYHSLTQVEIPVPFRKPLPRPPPPGTSLSQVLEHIDKLCSICDFVGAAHLASICLTSGLVQPTDYVSIFKLLAIRFSCLELIGQILLAAQEAKALEDLSSEFYYVVSEVSEAEAEAHGGQRPLAKHIMPFSLRVQAARLQNIGFSDPRRGVTALYDLGLEVREHLASPYTSEREQEVWTVRLESLGMHVVNALIELGDLDCASRTLAQSKPKSADPKVQGRWLSRMVLLLVRLGHVKKAHDYVDQLQVDNSEKEILASLVAVADGDIDEGARLLEKALQNDNDGSEMANVAKQNLAVVYVYVGRITEARKMLEDLVEEGHSFSSLTINLTTIFDLMSDKARDLKIEMVAKLATAQPQSRAFSNADFKL